MFVKHLVYGVIEIVHISKKLLACSPRREHTVLSVHSLGVTSLIRDEFVKSVVYGLMWSLQLVDNVVSA